MEKRTRWLVRLLVRAATLLLCALPWLHASGNLPLCQETDYYFEYTECDSTSSRWRVAIPHRQASCRGLPEPVRGTDCTFSCETGEFLEMSSQQCTACAAGSYSLGSGVRFDQWDSIPTGFSSLATYMEPEGAGDESLSCNNSSWTPQGTHLESNRDECTVSLVYAVHLMKQGSVSFDYQYVDNNVFFEFFIQNDQCQEMDQTADQKWIKLTSNGEWGTHTVNLKSGTNILYWRTTGILLGGKPVKPVLLKNIQIEGVAYTSECFPCRPGTFSKTPGSSSCDLCPRNTYSGKGASSCTPCPETKYSEEGWSECKDRPLCSDKDYFQIHTACDSSGKTQVLYRWVEPKVCVEDGVTGAVTLPPSGEKEDCPPCNPGFYTHSSSTCLPCPPGTYSNGTTECQVCPGGTEPSLAYEYKWWNVLPRNIKTSCFNVANSKCDDMNGWDVAGDHIRSGVGGSDNDYLILTLRVSGFKLPTSLAGVTAGEFGRITFIFETICSADCELYFMMDVNRKSTNVVESWEGTKSRRAYTHIMTKNASVSYTWAFQRTSKPSDVRRYVNDIVKIYSITVTNAIDGTASSCHACALVSQEGGSSCVPCPPGHFIDKDTKQCQECPPDTFLSGHHIYSQEACQPCGPGSRSNKEHTACFSDCSFSHTDQNRTLTYDLSALSAVGSIMNGPSFTSKGTKYYHQFNISLCGAEGRKVAVCTDNVTDLSTKDLRSESASLSNYVESFVCQSTIIPADGRGFRMALSSQSISLADTFLGATVDTALNGVNVRADLFPETSESVPDIHFFYRSPQVTSCCERGRTAVITLRCSLEKGERGDLTVSSKCPAGTCDGCAFYFLWESSSACPICTDADYHAIEGACKGGTQDTLYVWNEPKLCTEGVSLPEKSSAPCEAVPLWLKVGIGGGAFMAVLLISLTCYFWKKNKRLEYKYSRLVMSANKECELPAADSCALAEGEGEENEDDVVYSSTPSLLGKLKAIASKKQVEGENSESVQLKSSQAERWVWG
ncbi:endosome/lysosome-associated apoptosis and autophagy regulator family member 2 isoform X1 [Electrophorus electricus]|uniref:endosome/lysosome-associated apoptosis and autophagy regulator family member 2 isoform X1 n=1 Tax=Electrophorus electricus TaxID=8005 RepID=UPI0015D08AC7|nr:endosome/lysosome-associated apoptosis and autophagy regulator family member 2 isoform X1 [Electrophorus electricus]